MSALREHKREYSEALIGRLEAAGITRLDVAEITDANVRLDVAPASVLSPELRQEIRTYKSWIAEIVLRRRAERGSDYLWELEQAGKMDTPEYDRLLRKWTDLWCGHVVLADRNAAAAALEEEAA